MKPVLPPGDNLSYREIQQAAFDAQVRVWLLAATGLGAAAFVLWLLCVLC